jgi:hypothetical protein
LRFCHEHRRGRESKSQNRIHVGLLFYIVL